MGFESSSGSEALIPDSVLSRHALVVGRPGVGKTTLLKMLISHRFERTEAGDDVGPLVVIVPDSDLVDDFLGLVPASLAPRVRHLDFGSDGRVPALNVLDPRLFPDRWECVETVVDTFRHLWFQWGGRMEDLIRKALLILYEFNSHLETSLDGMLTVLDVLPLLGFDPEGSASSGGELVSTAEASPFQSFVLSRVEEPRLGAWFQTFLDWPVFLRAEALAPLRVHLGAYSSYRPPAVALGQRESSLDFSALSRDRLILLVSTGQGSLGVEPAALLGGAVVSAVRSSLWRDGVPPHSGESGCLLVCDESSDLAGVDWLTLLSGPRGGLCSMVLSSRSLRGLRFSEPGVATRFLEGLGLVAGYRMDPEDAEVLAPAMGFPEGGGSVLTSSPDCSFRLSVNDGHRFYGPYELSSAGPPAPVCDGSVADAVRGFSRAWTLDWQEASRRVDSGLGLAVG